jgi:ubiquinone/menaquinone biosynthesis C-methylase UbiE
LKNARVHDEAWIPNGGKYRLKFAHFPYLRKCLLKQRNNASSDIWILDVGCGPGNLAEFCGKAPGWKWFGLDLYEYQLRQAASKNVYENLSQVNLVDGLPFRDGSFDAVVCNEVLMYLPNSDEMLAESYRVLRPGGRLFVYNPTSWAPKISAGFKSFFRKIYHEKDSVRLDSETNWRNGQRVSRITYYSFTSLVERVAWANFLVTDVAGFRLIRNRIRWMTGLENFACYRCFVKSVTARFPYLATDILVVGDKKNP